MLIYYYPLQNKIHLDLNLPGEVMKELLSSDLGAGLHIVIWNANDKSGNKVSIGVYFYELKATGVDGNQFKQIRKLILLK